MKPSSLFALGAALGSLLAGLCPASAQITAFTYQGRLSVASAPATGSYDLTFALFSTSSSAGQLGNTITNAATPVSNGLFTVTLDFGNQFPGANRWLELGVRASGGGAFATLSPRQPLTPTPYAIAAASVTGTVPLAQLPASVVTNGATGVSVSGAFAGNGSGLTSLNATNLTGTLADTALSPNVATLNRANQTFTGPNHFSALLQLDGSV